MPKLGAVNKREDDQTSPLTFSGASSKECESFVHAIHNFSRSQGRSYDDDWILDLARASLVGPALRWYAELPEEAQNNWRALRSALFRRYQANEDVDTAADDEHNLATIPFVNVLRKPIEREVVFRGSTAPLKSHSSPMFAQGWSRKRASAASFGPRAMVAKKLRFDIPQDPNHPETTAHLCSSHIFLFSAHPQEFKVSISSNEEWTLDDAQPPPSVVYEGIRRRERADWLVEVGPQGILALDGAHIVATPLCSKARSKTWLLPMPEREGTLGTILTCDRVPTFVHAVLDFDLIHPTARDEFTEHVLSLLVGFRHVALRFARVDTGEHWAPLQIRPEPASTIRVLMTFQAATHEELEHWDEEGNLEGEVSRWCSVVTGGSERDKDEGTRDIHLCNGGIAIEIAAVVFKPVGGER